MKYLLSLFFCASLHAQLVSGVLTSGRLYACTTNPLPPVVACTELWQSQTVNFFDARSIVGAPFQKIHNTNTVGRTVCKIRFFWASATGVGSTAEVYDTSFAQFGGASASVSTANGWVNYTWTVNKPTVTALTDFYIVPRCADGGVGGDVVYAGNGYDDDTTYVLFYSGSPVASEDLMFEIYLEDP